jgi:Tfp pilus assembly protein PilE
MQKTKGLTFIGMLFTMSAVVIIGVLAMRVVPVYIQHYTVVRSLQSLSSLPANELSSDAASNETSIKRSLMKQFEVNDIDYITDSNITISPKNTDQLIVTVQYQVTRPFIANISLLFNFNDSHEVSLGRE